MDKREPAVEGGFSPADV